MRLILVRHGETLWNEEGRVQGFSDIDLSEKGRSQARRTAAALAGEPIAAIYASPLLRALHTAEEIARPHHGLAVRCDPALKELNQGDLEGISIKEMRERYGEFLKLWRDSKGSVPMPNGESIEQVSQRAGAFMKRIKEAHPDGTVVVISHSFTMFTIIGGELGMSCGSFGNMQLRSCGITVLDINGAEGRLLTLNDTCHLQE